MKITEEMRSAVTLVARRETADDAKVGEASKKSAAILRDAAALILKSGKARGIYSDEEAGTYCTVGSIVRAKFPEARLGQYVSLIGTVIAGHSIPALTEMVLALINLVPIYKIRVQNEYHRSLWLGSIRSVPFWNDCVSTTKEEIAEVFEAIASILDAIEQPA